MQNRRKWNYRHCRGRVDVIHCGNLRPAGYAVTWPHVRLGIPYLLYVYGGDLLRQYIQRVTRIMRWLYIAC